ncbi:hypothetical protein WJX72_006330 [[Myrmecia] bisecta]|uniref:FAD-binding FR-type domain-containing protein n=1 Tax=[Myrmecia] bisecta TaxID=41462 RepID=A0AAW1NZU1_9CHLO
MSGLLLENKAESVDGCLRTLVLSVEDHVEFLEGRKISRRQESPRWIDAYKVPGQFIGIRYPADSAHTQTGPLRPANRLYAIASSPYQAKSESADLDASIIEVLVDRDGGEDDQKLAELGPGSLAEISQVVGRGYASLFNTYVGLLSALEESRDLLLIGMGAKGIAPLRAALQWTPLQAHATAKSICLYYMCGSATSAAYVKEWDLWREAGIRVNPIYLSDAASSNNNGNGTGSIQAIKDGLEEAIFGAEAGLAATMGGNPRECAVLLSGLPGDVAAGITRRLGIEGVAKERILFCDFF